MSSRTVDSMKLLRHEMTIASQEPLEFIDITSRVRDWVRESGVRQGLLAVMSPHTTARIHLNELDPKLQHDMRTFLTTLLPPDGSYAHNIDTVDDRDNAHAHLMGLFLNASETIPIVDGILSLGDWQSLFLVELDGPRARRTVMLHCIGEA